MSTNKRGTRYDEEFKRTLVNLYQSGGKTQAALCKEYGVSQTALTRWIKQYSTVEICSERIDNVQNVNIAPRKGSFEGMSTKRDITIKLIASDAPEKVYYNDEEIAWHYDGNDFALVVDLPTDAWENTGNLRVEYPQGETLDLLDGIKGDARRMAKAILGLKCRKADIVLNDELGLFGSIGEKVTYYPETLRESVEQFRDYFNDLEQSLENQGLSAEDKAWFKAQVVK